MGGFSKVFDVNRPIARASYPVDRKSAIGVKWLAIGGQPTTGNALSPEMPLDDGIGRMQMFMVGVIFWSPAFGAVYMSERVWRKWSAPSVEKTVIPGGELLQAYLGYPTEDSGRHGTVGGVTEWMYFERGMIHVGQNGFSSVVYGAIYARYRILGGFNGFLGAPTSDERKAPRGGRVARFAHGDMYKHPATGAREVHGAIRTRYLDLGGPDSMLGYPTSDEESLTGPRGEIGRCSRFENGSGIYWSGGTGAWEVYGGIWAQWMANGGPSSKLGLPISGETDTPSSGGRYNEFQHGVMVWHGGGPYMGAFEVIDLQLVIAGYTVNDDYNVQVHVTATPNQVNHGRMPADGEFDSGPHDFSPPLVMVSIAPARGDSKMTVWLEAISENTAGKDDRMGVITGEFTIDNVWGLTDTDFNHHNTAFDARFRVQPLTRDVTSDPHELFWPFDNTTTVKLSWEQFARTFRDVSESDKHLSFNPFDLSIHPWEIFLYEAVYNSQAEGGFCFGACLEAIYAREQRSLFIERVQSNPFNPYQRNHPLGKAATKLNAAMPGDGVALEEINVKHGYQLGAGLVEFFVSRWMAGALHDPERAYRESYNDFITGNWPLLTVSDEDKFSQSGHALLPYDWVPTPDRIASTPADQPLIIYVKNPNFPTSPREDKHCRIEIDRRDWSFRYQHSDTETWTGSGDSGGRLLAIPFSELNSRPVTPGYAVMSLIAAGVYLVFGGDGSTEQISDGYGRSFFRYAPVTSRQPQSLYHPATREINWDPATRIPNLIEVPRFSAFQPSTGTTATGTGTIGVVTQASPPELYYHRPGPPPPRDPSHLYTSTTSTTGMMGVGSQRNPAALADAIAGEPGAALHFQVRGTGHGKMHWTATAARMSASVSMDAERGIVDSIHLGGAGGHFQSVTVQVPHANVVRQVALTLTGWRGEDRQQTRSFVLEKLSIGRSDSVRAQISDGGRELMIENLGAARTFDLRLVTGLKADTIATRANIRLEAASVVRLRPTNWSTTASPIAPIHLDVMASNRLDVVKSLVL